MSIDVKAKASKEVLLDTYIQDQYTNWHLKVVIIYNKENE